MKPEITYIEFSFFQIKSMLDWSTCFLQPEQAATQRTCLSGVPVFINIGCRPCAKGGVLKRDSLPAALDWGLGGFWVSAVFPLPLTPKVGHTGTSVLCFHLPGEGSYTESWQVPHCPGPWAGQERGKNECHSHFLVLTLETATSPQLPFLFPVPLTSQWSLPNETGRPLSTKEMSTTQELYTPQHTHTHTHTHKLPGQKYQMQCIGLTRSETDVSQSPTPQPPSSTHTHLIDVGMALHKSLYSLGPPFSQYTVKR